MNINSNDINRNNKPPTAMQVTFIQPPIQQVFNAAQFMNTLSLIDHNNRMMTNAAPTPTHTDVLLGRGVAMNRHPGNENFRAIVSQHVDAYMISTKKQKMLISRSIVNKVQTSLVPPGRFLEKDADTGLWRRVEDKRALEKTAQALRDGAAPLKKQLTKDLGDADFFESLFDEKVKAVGSQKSSLSKSLVVVASPKSGTKHRRTKTTSDVAEFLSSSFKKQRSDPDMVSSSMTSAVDMDRLIMAGLRRPQSCSSSSQQQMQQQQILAQHLSQSVPQHHQLSSVNINSAFPQPEVPVSNPLAAAMMPQQQEHQQQHRRVSNEGPNPSAAVAAMVSRQGLNFVPGSQFSNYVAPQQPMQPMHDTSSALFNLPQLQLPAISVSAPPSSCTYSTPSVNVNNTHPINNDIMVDNTMEPLPYNVQTPPPQDQEIEQLHQVMASSLEDIFSSHNNNGMMDQNEEFVREMGSDEHFFGLCNSDPIGDANFD